MNYNAMGKLLEFSITSYGYEYLCLPWQNRMILNGSFYRLYWNSSPGAGVFINGSRHYLLPGYFYLLPPNCNLPTFCDNDTVEQVFVHFVLSQYDCASLLTAIPVTDIMMQYVINLKESFSSDDSVMSVRRQIYAFAWCASAVAALPKEIFSVRPRMVGVERVCNLMEKNPAADLNIALLAHVAGLPPAEFNRRFKEATGHTPYAYLNNIRYENASAMLSYGTSSIEEICDAIGIKDRFHFSRNFKKRYGYPPIAYRRMMQAQELPKKQ